MTTLAALIITQNEEANIEACLQTVTWADEIIVIDSGSIDKTCEIARKYTSKVVFHSWAGYSAQKNYGHSMVGSDWILSIDADERVTPELRDEIQTLLTRSTNDTSPVAYRIPIRDWMFGKFVNFGSWPHQKHVRLYRSGEVSWTGVVHERQVVMGEVGHLSHPLLHYSHTSIDRFIDKLNRYTDIEANEMFSRGVRIRLASAAFGAVRAFLGQYIRLQGFRDGGHGLILAVLMAMYFFTTRAKLWSLWYSKEHDK